MKKGSFISLILIIIGGLLIIVAGWNMLETKIETTKSLNEAKEIIRYREQDKKVNEDKETLAVSKIDPEIGETFGILSIPAIDAELPIVEGTDPDELEKGVGHYRGSFYPGEDGQIVLSGHRDTVFRQAGKLKLGDELMVKIASGDYKYQIINTKIVDSDDTSIITLQDNEEELLLTTCYPFSYVGNAPERYIIYAQRVEN